MKIERITNQNENNAWGSWNSLKNQTIKNKQDIKGTTLKSGLTLDGIGEKCLMVGNNFINWESLFNHLYYEDEELTDLEKEILEVLFEDYENNESNTTEDITLNIHGDFEENKTKILQNKTLFRKEHITGIGEKNIKLFSDYEAVFVDWNDIKRELQRYLEDPIKYKLTNREYYVNLILNELFNIETEPATPEKAVDELIKEHNEITTEDLDNIFRIFKIDNPRELTDYIFSKTDTIRDGKVHYTKNTLYKTD